MIFSYSHILHIIPLSQLSNSSGIPWDLISYAGQGNIRNTYSHSLFSKSNPLISSSALQQKTCCGLSLFSAPILRRLRRSWQCKLLSSYCGALSPPCLQSIPVHKWQLPIPGNTFYMEPSSATSGRISETYHKREVTATTLY